MKFRYKKIAPGLIRPIILKHQGNAIAYEGLIDSGADMCVFPAQIGELIGLDIKKGQKSEFGGVVGKREDVYYHDIVIEIGGNSTQISAGFTYSSSFDYGFLGQKGLFTSYIVQFNYRKGIIDLRPDPSIN